MSKWGKIEENFGDRLHVRGLAGILQCAETYLRDHPLAVFLLYKMCVTDSVTVSWKVITCDQELVPVRSFQIPLDVG